MKTRTCLKHFKNELNLCKDFGSEDKLYCGTYCYNSCNTFSRSESGVETRSQTFQFLIDILNQNQVVEQVSTDIYTCIHSNMLLNLLFKLFLDEKVLMLPVVYEKYKFFLSMNINAEIYKFSFTEKNFSKCDHLLTFFQSLEQIK